MHSGERWRLGHRPGLDGLRGIAIGLVLLGHGAVPGFAVGGKVGVTLFFVLSGFLITALLLEERADTGRISLRAFYLRRLRRLGPAFALCFAVTCVLGAAADAAGFWSIRDAALSLSYVGNWYPALMSVPKPAPLGAFTGTWSLSVEEQFYLLWPAVAILVIRHRAIAWVAAAGIVLSVADRFALDASGATAFRIYYGTDTNAAALLLGALIAVALSRRVTASPPAWLLPVALVGLVAMSSVLRPWVWAMLPVCGFAALAVFALAAGPVPGSWLAPAWLAWLGRRSYAVYLWNCLIAVAVFWTPMSWPVRLLVVAVPSLVLAELSWRCVERPVLVGAADTTQRTLSTGGQRVVATRADTETV